VHPTPAVPHLIAGLSGVLMRFGPMSRFVALLLAGGMVAVSGWALGLATPSSSGQSAGCHGHSLPAVPAHANYLCCQMGHSAAVPTPACDTVISPAALAKIPFPVLPAMPSVPALQHLAPAAGPPGLLPLRI
jgi:hypothetical protein